MYYRESDSSFFSKVNVPVGAAQFKYVAENKWIVSSSFPQIPDGTGGLNNRVIVTERGIVGENSSPAKSAQPQFTASSPLAAS
jgi:hypothetical protein